MAQALEGLPEIERALRTGELHWSAARELSRVAVPHTEGEWLTAARGKSSRELERLVAGRRPGDKPGDPAREEARLHLLRFEVHAETLALFRDAVAHLRRHSDTSLDDDDALLLLLAREILQGPVDSGRANYQIAITKCDRCRQVFQQGGADLIPIAPEIMEMASCDAQHLGTTSETHVGTTRATQSVPPATRRRVMRRDHGRCVVPGCRHATFVDVHHLALRSAGGSHQDFNLIALCGAHHRAIHHGQLIVEGAPETGLRFFHADGGRYGAPSAASESDAPTFVAYCDDWLALLRRPPSRRRRPLPRPRRSIPLAICTDVREELVKVGIQVFVFGLAGGGVKLLLDRQTEERRFRSEILERLGRAHKDVYRIRRLLPTSDDNERRALLRELMDARQDLGATSHALRIGDIGAKLEAIQQETRAMRAYLKKVIHGAFAPPDAPERQPYTSFLNWQVEEGPYKTEFKKPYLRAKILVDPSFREDPPS